VHEVEVIEDDLPFWEKTNLKLLVKTFDLIK
jgi:hypothetical protein